MQWGRTLSRHDRRAIVAAIRDAEVGNRGEVRVHIERTCNGDARERARAMFGALGMHETRDDTGVLLYVAARSRAAAVWAGGGIHGAAADGFWQQVTDAVAEGFSRGAGAEGITNALGLIGGLLREHVPGDDDAGNELPDEVTTG